MTVNPADTKKSAPEGADLFLVSSGGTCDAEMPGDKADKVILLAQADVATVEQPEEQLLVVLFPVVFEAHADQVVDPALASTAAGWI
jgi:hypothetical protein